MLYLVLHDIFISGISDTIVNHRHTQTLYDAEKLKSHTFLN